MKIYQASSAPQEKMEEIYFITNRMLSYHHIITKAFSSDKVFQTIKKEKEDK